MTGAGISYRHKPTPGGRGVEFLLTRIVKTTRLFRLAHPFSQVGYSIWAEHYVFPWHGREQKIDPSRPITSWRTAWRSILKKAARNDAGEVIFPGLLRVWFHDARPTAVTTLAEKGLPDWVIQAQVGHVAPQMMKTYSHVRRLALDQAAAALEPASQLPKPVAELVN